MVKVSAPKPPPPPPPQEAPKPIPTEISPDVREAQIEDQRRGRSRRGRRSTLLSGQLGDDMSGNYEDPTTQATTILGG